MARRLSHTHSHSHNFTLTSVDYHTTSCVLDLIDIITGTNYSVRPIHATYSFPVTFMERKKSQNDEIQNDELG